MAPRPPAIDVDELSDDEVRRLALDLRAPGVKGNPYPLYRRLREIDPVYDTGEGWVICTRYDDCVSVLRDPRTSVTAEAQNLEDGAQSTLRQVASGVLLFTDPPDHTRIRGLVNRAFTPRRVAQIRERAGEIVDELLDTAAQRGEMDVLADLAYPLPVRVICDLLGVPVVDQEQFKGWSSDAGLALDMDSLTEDERARVANGVLNLMQYFQPLFDERRANPGDDLLSALVLAESEGHRLTESELRANTLLLFVAGHETTMNLIGNGMYELLSRPDELRRLQDDPSLIDSAVEEMLRFESPVHLTGRVAAEDMEVAGVPVPAGSSVTTVLAAANHDPARFTEPERFDIGRDDGPPLSFSHGHHFCLGASLARMEAQEAIGRIVARFPEIELITTDPQWRRHFILRGYEELRISLD